MAEIDNLTRDVLAAEAAGYGPWYGRFIADHGHTAIDTPAPVEAPRKTAVCPLCGQEFVQKVKWPRKYCGPECQERAKRKQQYAAKEKKSKKAVADCAAPPE